MLTRVILDNGNDGWQWDIGEAYPDKTNAICEGFMQCGQELVIAELKNTEHVYALQRALKKWKAKGFIPAKKRAEIPTEDFADKSSRKYPIIDQTHLDSAVKLLGKAPKSKQAGIKKRIIEIAKRKKLKIPESWVD